jgi:hypothetical protein
MEKKNRLSLKILIDKNTHLLQRDQQDFHKGNLYLERKQIWEQ